MTRAVFRWIVFTSAWIGAAVPVCAQERFQTTIPGAGIDVSFIGPTIAQFQGDRQGERFRFMSASEDQGTVITLFAEPWKSGDSAACRTEYWNQGSRNPAVVKDSIKQLDVSGRPAVSYLLSAEVQGKHFRSQNINVYLVQSGRCFDVHLSRSPGQSNSETELIAIASSLSIGPAKGEK
jgi:hypothetical protein